MSALAQWSAVDAAADLNEMDVHIQQTNDRLQCIQQHLMSPATFQSAARELLEWCSDTRAFQWQFEPCLVACLTVVSQISGQPGYDLDLGYRLMAVCAAHRDKFSPKSAGSLSLWCEELGRQLLLRHQNSQSLASAVGGGGKGATDIGNNPMQKHLQPTHGAEMLQWQQQTGQQPSQADIGTSVWGVTQSNQAPPGMYNNHNPRLPGYVPPNRMTSGSYGQQPASFNGDARMHKIGYSNGAAGMAYGRQQPTVAAAQAAGFHQNNGFSQTPGGVNPSSVGAQNHESMSAGALLAATANAAAVMGIEEQQRQQQTQQQQQQQQQQQMAMNSHYAAQMGPRSVMAGGPQQFGPQYNPHYGNPYQGVQKVSSPISMSMGSGPPVGSNLSMVSQSAGPAHTNPAMSMQSGGSDPMMQSGAMMGGIGPGAAGGSMKGNGMVMKSNMYNSSQAQRPMPYPTNPQQYMHAKRAQFPASGQMPPIDPQFGAQQYVGNPYSGPMMPQQQSQQPYPWGAGRPNCPPSQQQSPNYCPQPRPNGSYGGGNGQTQGMYNMPQKTHGRPVAPGYNQFGQMAGYSNPMFGQPSPVLSNPTPPMTPGGPPYLSPTADVKPVIVNGKHPAGMMKNNGDDLRLTFPIRDGIVLAPFRLEHNLSVSNHVFHLRESVFQTLMLRPDLELQLKCFHHEDRNMNTNWPVSVTVSVNAWLLAIERGDNRTCHRPLYLKDICLPGRNTIQITVSACCCSHLFVLQLVHRPSVKSVLQGLLRKRLLPAEHCITKIKRSFTQPQGMQSNTMVGDEGVEQTGIKLRLSCPITCRPIALPARGHDCKHIQCFDLESYLHLNCERGLWRCPICNKPALLEGLEIDQFIWGILHGLGNNEFEEVTIDAAASWKPIPLKSAKEEDVDSKRWIKAVSPSSMTLPTMNSWQESSYHPSQPNSAPMNSFQQAGIGSMCGSNNSALFSDASQSLSPSFPTVNTPDFLSSLSQMNDNLLSSDKQGGPGSLPRTPLDGQSYSAQTPGGGEASQSYHPRTPLDNFHPGTPGDGQNILARTPGDHQSCQSRGSSHDGSLANSEKLRHLAPGTPGSLGNPGSCNAPSRTGKNGSADPTPNNNGGGNGGYRCDSSNGFSSATMNVKNGTCCTSGGQNAELSQQNDDIGSTFDTDIGFHTSSLLDSESQSQEELDLLPDNIGDPTELLSYLGPAENGGNTNDELLSLFS